MDRKLVGWARAVKARRRERLPPLWLLIDQRLADPESSVRALRRARGLFGVVLRGITAADRATLAARLAPLCRGLGLPLVISGDPTLANTHRAAGLHLPGGRRPPVRRRRRLLLTASAHDRTELRRALRAGARLVFLSPVFPTRSHPGAPTLGPLRAARLARALPAGIVRAFALGGIDGARARALPPIFAGAGAIDALATACFPIP